MYPINMGTIHVTNMMDLTTATEQRSIASGNVTNIFCSMYYWPAFIELETSQHYNNYEFLHTVHVKTVITVCLPFKIDSI